MPIVPRYDEQQVQVGQGPQPGLKAAPVENYQAKQTQEAGRAVMGAADKFANIQSRMLQQMNEDRVRGAMAEAIQQRSKLTDGDRDEQGNAIDPGFRSYKGDRVNASGAPLDAMYGDKYSTKLSEIEQRLGNDAQRAKFREWATSQDAEFRGDIRSHIAREAYSAGVENSKNLIQQYTNVIASNVGDEKIFNDTREKIIAEADALAFRTGVPADGLRREALSDSYTSSIRQLVDSGDVDKARYLLGQAEANQDIDAKNITALKSLVSTATDIEREQTLADQFIEQSGGDYSAALKMAKTLTGKERDNVERRIQSYQAEAKRQKQERFEAAADKVIGIILDNNGDVSKVKPTQWAELDESDELRIRQAFTKNAGKQRSPSKLIHQLNYLLGNDIERFKKFDLYSLPQYGITPTDLKYYRGIQDGLRKDDPEAKAIVTTATQISKAGSDLKGVNRRQFEMVAMKVLQEERDSLGRNLTIDETNKKLAELRRTPDTWWKHIGMEDPEFKTQYEGAYGAE